MARRIPSGLVAMGRGALVGATIALVWIAMEQAVEIRDPEERIAAIEELAPGRQQGVSAPECPSGEGAIGHAQTLAGQGLRKAFGSLAQSAEQRTFNPLPTSTPAQPEAKLSGFPRDFDARSASGCAGLHVGRVSAGRQEGRK